MPQTSRYLSDLCEADIYEKINKLLFCEQTFVFIALCSYNDLGYSETGI